MPESELLELVSVDTDAERNRFAFIPEPKFRWMKRNARPKAATSDAELLRRFASGDDVAFRELYERHTQKLFRYTFGMIGDALLAEDIVQTAWERIIDRRSSVEEIRILPAFLFNIARNLALDQFRRSSHSVRVADLSIADQPLDKQHERSQAEELILTALETLPWETREMLVLHYESGYSFEEIAAMFDKRPNAIWTRVSRARTILKKIVERELRREQHAEEGQE